MERDLSKILDLEEPEEQTQRTEAQQPEKKAELPKAERQELPSGNYGNLLVDVSTENYGEQNKMPYEDLGLGLGTLAGLYAGRKAQQGLVLPSQVRNSILNLQNLNKELGQLHIGHASNLASLEEAEALAKYLNSEQALANALPEHLRPAVPPAQTGLTFTQGPEAVSNYQKKFVEQGFKPTYGSAEGASMQDVQRRLIPQQQAAASRAEQISPGARRVAEAGDLYLTPEGQRAKLELIQKEQAAREAQALAAEAEKQRIYARQEPQRLAAEKAVARAQSAVDASETALRDLQNRQSALGTKVAVEKGSLSPGLQRVASAVEADSRMLPQILQTGSRLLSKVAMPLTVASIPYETKEAYEAAKRGEWGQAGKHAIGAGSGALTLAAPVALALGAAPAVAAGMGTAGVLGGLGVLASDLPDIYQGVRSKFGDYFQNR